MQHFPLCYNVIWLQHKFFYVFSGPVTLERRGNLYENLLPWPMSFHKNPVKTLGGFHESHVKTPGFHVKTRGFIKTM